MIITKTPLRISFLGGGTDYPDFFNKFGSGAVLGTAINKHIYLTISKFYSELFDYSIRLSYSKIECVKNINQIKHIPIRECLRCFGIKKNIEINVASEIPAYTGLGSSSSFVVGLLNSLHAFKGEHINKMELTKESIYVEQELLKEPVGCQDQTLAAFGNFNLIKFYDNNKIQVKPVSLSSKNLEEFENHLLLFFTGIKRKANNFSKSQITKINDNKENLKQMRMLVDSGYKSLTKNSDFEQFGKILNESWELKKNLDKKISNDIIDQIYNKGKKAGAIGGKLLGAGGGGFILFFVEPQKKKLVRKKLNNLIEIPIKLEKQGSTVLQNH